MAVRAVGMYDQNEAGRVSLPPDVLKPIATIRQHRTRKRRDVDRCHDSRFSDSAGWDAIVVTAAFVAARLIGRNRRDVVQWTKLDRVLGEDARRFSIIVDGEQKLVGIALVERSSAGDVSPLDVASMP